MEVNHPSRRKGDREVPSVRLRKEVSGDMIQAVKEGREDRDRRGTEAGKASSGAPPKTAEGRASVDIWIEKLERRHLPLLENWLGRSSGRMTPNDLPTDAEKLTQWYETCTAEPGRQDHLVLVYETPVGVAGLRRREGREGAAELYLLLGETGYNLLRTATYAVLRLLSTVFREDGLDRVSAELSPQGREILPALERMGFSREGEDGGLRVSIEKKSFQERKYLF